MGLRCIRERIGLIDHDPDGTGQYHPEQILRHRQQVGALFAISVERRSGEEERTFAKMPRSTGPSGPEDCLKLTIRPFGRRQSSDFMKVSLPIESWATGNFSVLLMEPFGSEKAAGSPPSARVWQCLLHAADVAPRISLQAAEPLH